ncbi:polysaccharide lyase family 7 protein [Aestuariibacter sp. A3R04]|uniref:polysaccharide lyase family 7 protein n=1 Tax=Aestuariibacter sp. A3R04 TaxID=2841571 RepID=UPI002091E13A|nr:polysaccharide lyase family 7 protein [Aestuariibacter sp. A3R04]
MPEYPTTLAIDGDTFVQSRWAFSGDDGQLLLDLGSEKNVGALAIKWFESTRQSNRFTIDLATNTDSWLPVSETLSSSTQQGGFELYPITESQARYVRISVDGDSEAAGIVEVEVYECQAQTGKFTLTLPSETGIELNDWYLSIPIDEDENGRSDSISETVLANGYAHSDFFYASADGGIVMRSPSYGYKTSQNTQYVRVELREMLRRGNTAISTQGVNKNNWVFGSTAAQAQQQAGGVDGNLHVSMAVNEVTTSGENYQIGRVIIGQIHANDDEPIRLYYRKLPNNERGSVYFAHESRGTDGNGDNIETYVEMIGSRANDASNPSDGIALDERFDYHISVDDNLLTVTISRNGKEDVVAHYDMADSGYDDSGQYQYFKVGVYHVNNSSDPDEFAQATFYTIRNSHTGYIFSE